MSFGASKDVYKVVSEAQSGDVFDVKSEKIAGQDGKEYWNWTGIQTAGKNIPGQSQASGKASPAPRSNFETPEERAQRQVYIIRQSSLSVAQELLSNTKGKGYAASDVIDLAEEFTDFVLNGNNPEVEEVSVD